MAVFNVNSTISISQKNKSICVELIIENNKFEKLYIEKRRVGLDARILINPFVIMCNSKRIAYNGPIGKYPAPGLADFVILKKGEKLISTIDITNRFLFYDKRSQYKIIFKTSVIPPDTQDIYDFTSNEVMFTY